MQNLHLFLCLKCRDRIYHKQLSYQGNQTEGARICANTHIKKNRTHRNNITNIIQQLPVRQMTAGGVFKKFSIFHRTKSFFMVFTKAHH